jgi:hypothetical protein
MINRRFTLLWTSETISLFGDRVTELALPLIAVVALAATPEQVGFLTAAVWAPNLLGVVVGSWADGRPDRKRLLVAADLLRAGTLLSLPIAHWFGVVTLTQLFVVALLTGAGQVLSMWRTRRPPERPHRSRLRHRRDRRFAGCCAGAKALLPVRRGPHDRRRRAPLPGSHCRAGIRRRLPRRVLGHPPDLGRGRGGRRDVLPVVGPLPHPGDQGGERRTGPGRMSTGRLRGPGARRRAEVPPRNPAFRWIASDGSWVDASRR